MIRSLFGKKKKKQSDSSAVGDSIKDAGVGDVFTVSGLTLEYDEAYFIIEKKNRYSGYQGEWFELLAGDGEKKLWVHWSDDRGLSVTVAAEQRPLGLNQFGITQEDLVRMDDEQSVDNYLTYDGREYYFKNSGEAFFFQDNTGDGEGFYVWDFAAEDGSKVLSVDKYEGLPFQGFESDVVPPEDIMVYKR